MLHKMPGANDSRTYAAVALHALPLLHSVVRRGAPVSRSAGARAGGSDVRGIHPIKRSQINLDILWVLDGILNCVMQKSVPASKRLTRERKPKGPGEDHNGVLSPPTRARRVALTATARSARRDVRVEYPLRFTQLPIG